MLKSDSRRQFQNKRDYSLAKAQLYTADQLSQLYQKSNTMDCVDPLCDVSVADETRQHDGNVSAPCCSSSAESSQPFLTTCRTIPAPHGSPAESRLAAQHGSRTEPRSTVAKSYKVTIPQGIQSVSSSTHCKRAMCNIAFHENVQNLARSSYISVSSPTLNASDTILPGNGVGTELSYTACHRNEDRGSDGPPSHHTIQSQSYDSCPP